MITSLKTMGETTYWRSLRIWYPRFANDNNRG